MSGLTIKEKDKKFIAGAYARQDVLFVRGEGSKLYDETGKEYLDFATGIAVNALGHNNKKWVEAVTKQAATLSHVSNYYYTEPCVKLAEILIERTGMTKIFFGNSGAEVNECAIKTARKYAYDVRHIENGRIITLMNSFHGRTVATLTATGQDDMHKPCFKPYADGFDYANANDIESIKAAIKPNTCAILMELVQGEGGVIPMKKEFVDAIVQICKDTGILLIIDEVQTGNGRTGSLYTFMQYGILPDIVTTAKGIGNGLPIGVIMFGDKTADVLQAGDHGTTFGANPIACAGAVAVLEQIDDELLKGVNKKREKLVAALEKMGAVRSTSGLGLMIGIETDDAKGKQAECLKKGLVTLTAHEKLRLVPALNVSDEDIDAAIEILKEVLK